MTKRFEPWVRNMADALGMDENEVRYLVFAAEAGSLRGQHQLRRCLGLPPEALARGAAGLIREASMRFAEPSGPRELTFYEAVTMLKAELRQLFEPLLRRLLDWLRWR